MSDNEFAIKLTNISKKYKLYHNKRDRIRESLHPFKKIYHKEFFALNNIDLEVKKSEILGIVGMNGSGKSTLLKIICGIVRPTLGEVNTNGNIVPLLELGTGFNPEYTGIENIYFYCSLLGFSTKEIAEKVNEIADFAEIGDHIAQPLKTFSSGMKARLAFAVSINVDPDILILDEVLSVGDELFRRKSFARMEHFFKAGKTILYVSHNTSSITQLCNRAILLDEGEIILDGDPKFVTYNFHKLLFSKPQFKRDVRNELISINQDINQRSSCKESHISVANKNKITEKQLDEKISEIQKGFFIPNFIPKSTVKIMNSEFDIQNLQILTDDNRKVNVLVPGENYRFCYELKVGVNSTNISCNMFIKTDTGYDLGGGALHHGNTFKLIREVKKGETYRLEWSFRCNLLKGTYYIEVAIRSITDGKMSLLFRVIDAVVFRVQETDIEYCTGIINFDTLAKVIRL